MKAGSVSHSTADVEADSRGRGCEHTLPTRYAACRAHTPLKTLPSWSQLSGSQSSVRIPPTENREAAASDQLPFHPKRRV